MNLWESGAIIEYLVDKYDTAGKISYPSSSSQKYKLIQWLHFQVSGQGPYFGQKAWFSNFHSEKNITSAIERYGNEIKRVVGVIDAALKSNGTGWLVGDKCTYADISFVPWNALIGPFLLGEEETKKLMEANPEFKKWHDSLVARPAIKKVLEAKAAKAQKH